MSFSRRVLHMDPLHLARFEASSPTRRDTRFRPHVLRRARPGPSSDLDTCPRVPVLTVMKGQQRSLVSSFAVYPRVNIRLVRALIAAQS
jgi:hypothetical protein